MEHARFMLAVPDDPALLGRLTTALAAQSDPPISLARSGDTVIAFESVTADLMLRSRVMQALEHAVGPDWQAVARPTGRPSRLARRALLPGHGVVLAASGV